MLFYEEGEPIVDGEPGDLKVCFHILEFIVFAANLVLTEFNLIFSHLFNIHFPDWILYVQFRIRTAPHDRFRREGNDLHTTVTITLVIFSFSEWNLELLICELSILKVSELLMLNQKYLLIYQVQALVGFEKTIKHLDEHLVDISSKVSELS